MNWAQYLETQFPTNNSRSITAALLRSSLLNLFYANKTETNPNTSYTNITSSVIPILCYEYTLIMQVNGAKTINVQGNLPEGVRYRVVNASATGNITFIFPSAAVGGYPANQVFTVTPRGGSQSFTPTMDTTFRGTMEFMKTGWGWVII